LLTKKQLINIKTKAIRAGVWFKVLQRIDRVLFDLTIRVVETIRSSQLANAVLVISNKLINATKSHFSSRLKAIGRSLAEKVSVIASKLGNVQASVWVSDESFIKFLAIMEINRAHSIPSDNLY
jgi:hypothetical protein